MDKAKFSDLGYHVVEPHSINEQTLERIKRELVRYDIPVPAEKIEFDYFDKELDLKGCNSYNELLLKYVNSTCGDDIELIEQFYIQLQTNGIPMAPYYNDIKLIPGWCQYDRNGKFLRSLLNEDPEDPILIFDTETFVKGGNLPIIGTATGVEYSYIWIAKEFIYEEEDRNVWDQCKLVPLSNTKIIVAHNAAFDLCRIRDSYNLPVKIKSIDTMSMHIVTNGLSSGQRYTALLDQKDPTELTYKEKAILRNPPKWLEYGTTNSLVAVYNFHVAKPTHNSLDSSVEPIPYLKDSDKTIRDVFVETDSMLDFINMGEYRKRLLNYASKDTYYTTQVFLAVYPKYKESKPHKAAMSGHLLLSTARVPLVDNWNEWIENCEEILLNLNNEVSDIILSECKELYKKWSTGDITMEQIAEDPFYSKLKWDIKKKKIAKDNSSYSSIVYDQLSEGNIPLNLVDYFKTNKIGKNYDYIPLWYEFIFKDPNITITPKTEISHYILRLHYLGYPIHKDKKNGWGYFLNNDFVKVKNHTSPGKNVGNLCAKSYVDDMQSGILTGEHPKSKRIFEIAIQTSFWISTRSRILERFYLTTNTPDDSGNTFPLMCPQPIVHGTLSGRVTENLFLVLCSPKKNKLGSEIKSRVRAPEGYKIVGWNLSGLTLNYIYAGIS